MRLDAALDLGELRRLPGEPRVPGRHGDVGAVPADLGAGVGGDAAGGVSQAWTVSAGDAAPARPGSAPARMAAISNRVTPPARRPAGVGHGVSDGGVTGVWGAS